MQQQIQIHNFEQKSEKWYNSRLGKITGSCFHKLLGTPNAAKKYLYSKANEIVIGDRCEGDKAEKTSIHMERGLTYEDMARFSYQMEKEYKIKIQQVGLIQLNDYIACSPDGLVDDNGLLEIKVPDSNNFFESILEIKNVGIKAIPKQYYQQMQFNLYVSGRKWCDYVLYNPQHDIKGTGIFIYRIELDLPLQKRIAEIVEDIPQKINNYVEQYYNIMRSEKQNG
jgi:exodeoxyribonuclease (lambda-induced)